MLLAVYINLANKFIPIFYCCYIEVLKFNTTCSWTNDDVVPTSIFNPIIV